MDPSPTTRSGSIDRHPNEHSCAAVERFDSRASAFLIASDAVLDLAIIAKRLNRCTARITPGSAH
jgi:hypothetical protein